MKKIVFIVFCAVLCSCGSLVFGQEVASTPEAAGDVFGKATGIVNKFTLIATSAIAIISAIYASISSVIKNRNKGMLKAVIQAIELGAENEEKLQEHIRNIASALPVSKRKEIEQYFEDNKPIKTVAEEVSKVAGVAKQLDSVVQKITSEMDLFKIKRLSNSNV